LCCWRNVLDGLAWPVWSVDGAAHRVVTRLARCMGRACSNCVERRTGCHRLVRRIGRACSDSVERRAVSSVGAVYWTGLLGQCEAWSVQLTELLLGWRNVWVGLARPVWSVGRVSAQPSCHTRLARRSGRACSDSVERRTGRRCGAAVGLAQLTWRVGWWRCIERACSGGAASRTAL
jgi:hypothetical protein